MREPPSLTIGIEEEYLVVDRRTRDLVHSPDPGFLEHCQARLGEARVMPEYLQCQIEIGTSPHARIEDAREELVALRAAVAESCASFGYAPIAASTHPFARWREQTHTRKPRYDGLRADLAQAARRLLICGCHMHVGVEDPDLRIDLMNQAVYFLPHLLALSCSSPFWEAEDTGLACYRLTVFDALPRTGLPDVVSSWGEYRRLVEHLVAAGCLEDGSKIWWDIRPSEKFPTVEQRITDVCSRVDDVVCIAAIYQALFAFLHELRLRNERWRLYPTILLRENRWRAMRYGVEGQLVDHGRAAQVPFATLLEELLAALAPHAETLGSRARMDHARVIARDGNSAMRQRRVLGGALAAGADATEARRRVVDHLIDEFTLA
jgi:carboxylate-amine ligase